MYLVKVWTSERKMTSCLFCLLDGELYSCLHAGWIIVSLSLDLQVAMTLSPNKNGLALNQMLYKSDSALFFSQVYDQMPEPRYVISMGR